MRALMSHTPGGPETLVIEERPPPKAGPGEVVVAVRACGINFPDLLIIEDKYQMKPPRPFSPGSEISGVITALGEGVTGLTVGQRVLAVPGWGGMVEEIALPADKVIPIPDAMPFDEAAAFLATYGTSYYALKDRGRVQPGQTLLVLGAAGGVGLAAVELGVAMGAKVIAAASSQEKCDLALAHGAFSGVVYPAGPFDRDGIKILTATLKAAVGPEGADVCYDGVGGDYAEAALRCMGWEGRFLVVGFPAGIPRVPLNLTLLKNCDIVGVFWGAAVARDPAGYRRAVGELFDLYGAGKIKPHISGRFSLDEAPAAFARLAGRTSTGKLVVVMARADADPA
jgi:NADPH2:quinone reductase